MSVGLYSHTTRATGTVLTAAIYNSDHQNHITNANPTMTGAYSDNLAEHQLNSDPGGLGTEILAGSLAVELEHLRFVIKRLIGESQWYVAPDSNIAALAVAATDLIAPAGTRILMQQTTPPAGWTKDGTHDDKAIRITSGAVGSGGSVAFSTVFGRTATSSHTLAVADVPALAVSFTYNRVNVEAGTPTTPRVTDIQPLGGTDLVSLTTNGGGGAHSHAMDNRVTYIDAVIGVKS